MSERILFLSNAGPSDQSTQHRIDPIADELSNRGYITTVIHGNQRSTFGRPFRYVSGTGIKELVSKWDQYDTVVMNRDGSPTAYLAALICDWKDIPLVFDIDDALYYQKRVDNTPFPNPSRIFLNDVVELATCITTGNDNIQRELSHLNDCSTTIPTPVDTSVFHPGIEPARQYNTTVLGWMGIGPGHEHNLRLLKDPLIRLGKDHDLTFRIISSLGDEEIHDMFTEVEEWVNVDYGYEERISLEEVRREMATFDIAVLPLSPSDKMMEGKSIIKVLEHLAMGLPVVASDALAYGDILTHNETGLLSNCTEDWVNNIERLLAEPKERERLEYAGYEMAFDQYTVEAYVEELERILDSVRQAE